MITSIINFTNPEATTAKCYKNMYCRSHILTNTILAITDWTLSYNSITLSVIYTEGEGTEVSSNRILPLANYCRSEEILFKSDKKPDLQVYSSNLCTEDKQICIKVLTSHIERTLCFRY